MTTESARLVERLRGLLAQVGSALWYHHGRAVTPTHHIFVKDETGKARAVFDVKEWHDWQACSELVCEAINALPALLDALDESNALITKQADEIARLRGALGLAIEHSTYRTGLYGSPVWVQTARAALGKGE